MKTKHMPGPWEYTYPEHTIGAIVFKRVPHSSRKEAVCEIRKPLSYTGRANARLIAAAPDLLEVCQNIHLNLKNSKGVDPFYRDCILALLEPAIAKATGEGK